MRLAFLCVFTLVLTSCDSPFYFSDDRFITKFEATDGQETASKDEAFQYYKALASRYGTISLKTINSDSLQRVDLVVFNREGSFNLGNFGDKTVVMITNTMYKKHSEGVDALMLIVRNLAQGQIKISKDIVVVVLPMIDDQFPQDKNQQKPLPKREVDIDKDFIKTDGDYSKAIVDVFHAVKADVLLDVGTIERQNNRETIFYQIPIGEKNPKISSYVEDIFLSKLSDSLKVKAKPVQADSIPMSQQLLLPFPKGDGFDASVNTEIGYASLWQTISVKIAIQKGGEYKKRVENLYNAIKTMLQIAGKDASVIKSFRDMERESVMGKSSYFLNYVEDSTHTKEVVVEDFVCDTIDKDSLVERIKIKKMHFPTKYEPKDKIEIPTGYVFSKTYWWIVEKMKKNKIEVKEFKQDTVMDLWQYKIVSYKTKLTPKDGHYKHFDVEIEKTKEKIRIEKGDVLIETKQKARQYILETLEPKSQESFFNWNFFDLEISNNKEIRYPIYAIE